jgi:hypothetical protein
MEVCFLFLDDLAIHSFGPCDSYMAQCRGVILLGQYLQVPNAVSDLSALTDAILGLVALLVLFRH